MHFSGEIREGQNAARKAESFIPESLAVEPEAVQPNDDELEFKLHAFLMAASPHVLISLSYFSRLELICSHSKSCGSIIV